MKLPKLISDEIDAFYSKTSEEARLELGLGPLEFERNKDLIQRYLPSKGIIADVGGGPGIYSEWLAGMGHQVYLIDPVAKHIRQAEKRAGKLKNPFKCIPGEARNLDLPGHFADVVILHGPLYHLQSESHRIACIAEARRVLKQNGILLGFAINRAASTIPGLLNGIIHDQAFLEMCREELSSGKHNPPASWPGILPEAYFHNPAQLRKEVEKVGLSCLAILAVEGMIWMDKNYFESRSDPGRKKAVMELLKLTENDESLLSLSPHMMIAAKKQ